MVGDRAHLEAADRIAERTTTLLVNEGALLPLSRRTHRNVLVVGADPASPSGTTGPPTSRPRRRAHRTGLHRDRPVDRYGTHRGAVIAQAVAAAARQDAVVVGRTTSRRPAPSGPSSRGSSPPGVPVVAVAVRNPYDVAQLPDGEGLLASYSWTDVELRAAARVIAGRVAPRGKLPVPVQRADDPARVLYPIGHGLTYAP